METLEERIKSLENTRREVVNALAASSLVSGIVLASMGILTALTHPLVLWVFPVTIVGCLAAMLGVLLIESNN